MLTTSDINVDFAFVLYSSSRNRPSRHDSHILPAFICSFRSLYIKPVSTPGPGADGVTSLVTEAEQILLLLQQQCVSEGSEEAGCTAAATHALTGLLDASRWTMIDQLDDRHLVLLSVKISCDIERRY